MCCRGFMCQHRCGRTNPLPVLLDQVLATKQQARRQLTTLLTGMREPLVTIQHVIDENGSCFQLLSVHPCLQLDMDWPGCTRRCGESSSSTLHRFCQTEQCYQCVECVTVEHDAIVQQLSACSRNRRLHTLSALYFMRWAGVTALPHAEQSC